MTVIIRGCDRITEGFDMTSITEANPMTLALWNWRIKPNILIADNGCWEWQAYRLPSGYGTARVTDSMPQYIHRLSHELWSGPIPDGHHVDHLCRNRPCCNPAHLEAVTPRVNYLRGIGFAAKKYAQTHCIHGHEFDALNTYIAPNGTRKCRTCRAETRRRCYQRKKLAA